MGGQKPIRRRLWALSIESLAIIGSLRSTDVGARRAAEGASEGLMVKLPSGDSVEFKSSLSGGRNEKVRRESQNDSEPSTLEVTNASARMPRISSAFGRRSDPIRGGMRRHEGVDFPGHYRAAIYATGAGTVRFAGWMNGYGNLIEIQHSGGLSTRYGHLSQLLVKPGEAVRRGEEIGLMGSTGRSTGTHLHYEVRVNGVSVNPLAYMGQNAPRHETNPLRWKPQIVADPHWTGWTQPQGEDKLPQARIH